jgi:hypothetical protein
MKFDIDLEVRRVALPDFHQYAWRRAMEVLNGGLMDVPKQTSWNEKMRMASLMIGQEGFEELLVALPDAFYFQSDSGKLAGWSNIYQAVLEGERDIDSLVNAVTISQS